MTGLQDRLGQAFPPNFAGFGHTLCVPGQDTARSALPLPDLLRPDGLAPVLSRYAARFPGADRRAVLSLWSQYYLLALVPAVVAAAVVVRRDLPVALDGMGVALSEAGQPTALCLPHAGCPGHGTCPAARLTPLLRAHLDPLARALTEAGLPPRVLWGNAGAVLAWSLGVITAPEADRAVVCRALAEACWVDGGGNPLCPVLAQQGRCTLVRRVCCLRFRLPGTPMCGDCPRQCNEECSRTDQAVCAAAPARRRSSQSPRPAASTADAAKAAG